jgi:hypothetical protein
VTGDGNRVSEASRVTTKYLIDTLNPTGYLQVLNEFVSGLGDARLFKTISM